MSILYIITKSVWGGAQRHVFDLATAMKKKGHEVNVALGGDGPLRTRLENASIFTHSINALDRDISATKDTSSFKEIFHIIKNKKPDILHLHSPKAAGLGAMAGRLLGIKKIIFTVHGWTFNEDRPIAERAMIAFFSWLTMLLCHRVILLSEHEYNQALHFPFIKNKLGLVRPGIQPLTFVSVDGAKQAIASKLGLNRVDFEKKTVITTIAELHPNKGLGFLIQAMEIAVQEHPKAMCVIIGGGQEESKLRNTIKDKKLEQKIFLTGNIDSVAEYLKAFTIFVLPSLKEGLPYVLLEAGLASLPVIATNVGGIPEIIEDMHSGIMVQSKNPRELAHAISFMIEQPDSRRAYGAALKQRVLERFSFSRMIKEMESVYIN